MDQAVPLSRYCDRESRARAFTSCARILDLTATTLDARTPFIFVSRDILGPIERLHELPDAVAERSSLFARLGLSRIRGAA